MAVHDLYFKRQKQLRGEYTEVYQYDQIPRTLKNQIVFIWKEVVSVDTWYARTQEEGQKSRFYKQIYSILLKELGLEKFSTEKHYQDPFFRRIEGFFKEVEDVEIELSIVELVFSNAIKLRRLSATESPSNLNFIKELNQRFRENGVGYQYENDQIIRVDSEFIHAEAVKPALQLLSNPMYKGAQEEFLKAHEHYRHGRYDSALTDCLKAFESTMKIIIHKRSWVCDKNAASKKLIDCCLANELIPKFWTDQFNSLSNILTSSIGTPRNKLSGHGKGNDEIVVPEHLIQYVLHMTASTIVFLIKAEESLD